MVSCACVKLVVVAGLTTALGCFGHEDFCRGAVHSCNGDSIYVCVDNHDEEHRWETRPCSSGYCVEVDEGVGAYCVSDPAPRPACEGVTDRSLRLCDGGELISCTYGYANVHRECPAPELCEPSLDTCTVRAGPQTECSQREPMDDDPAAFCEGDTRIRCSGEFAIEEQECGDGLCYPTSQTASCIVSTTPDSACTDEFSRYPYRVCFDNARVTCLGPYRVSTFDCGTGTCSENGCSF